MAARLQRLRRGELLETFSFAGPAFRRAAPWLLAGTLLVGMLLRLFPTLRYAVWGSDSGEYVYLTRRLVDTGRITFDYQGWGLAYPYFPGLFVVSGAVHAVLGIDTFHAEQWTAVLLASLIAPLVGLITYRITSDPRAGVVAAAFCAVTATLTVTTSHAMPGTLGQILLLFILALLPDTYRDRKGLALLLLLGMAALVLTHHLTTYFAVGIIATIAFYRELTQRASDATRLRIDVPLALFGLVAAATWWLAIATPFREDIVGQALPFPPIVTALLFLLALAALPALVLYKRSRSSWFARPRYPSFRTQRAYVLATGGALFAGITLIALTRVPGSVIHIGWITILYLAPAFAFLAFAPLGARVIRFHRQGVIAIGAVLAILASFAFSILTNSHVFFPFRHVDYLTLALAPLLAAGLLMIYDQTLAARVPADRPRARAIMLGGLIGLLVLSALLSFPPREAIGGFEEGVSDEEYAAVQWAAAHHDVIPQGSTIAADHRVSSLLWGLATLHATWDYTPRTYHAENATEALDELRAAKVPANGTTPTRVDYVFVSRPIEEGVTLDQFQNARPMSQAAIAKFDDATHFQKVYDKDGARIYKVLWPAG